jgi:hypothetical protein
LKQYSRSRIALQFVAWSVTHRFAFIELARVEYPARMQNTENGKQAARWVTASLERIVLLRTLQ